MRYSSAARPGRIAAALAGGAALALVATAAQSAQGAQSARGAQSAAAAPAPAAGGGRPVLLVNGDQLVMRAGGTTGTVLPAPGSGPMIALGHGARAVYLPLAALPYLGRGLAPGLFSPARLSRAESGGRLRVQIAFTGRRPRLPGVTITQSARGSARGYLTASSARVFGAALARQFRADHGRASYGTDGLFAGGVSIAPAGSSPALARPAPRAHPDYPMHELTVTGTNQAGRPDTGDEVVVLNAADWRTFGDPVEAVSSFYHGSARYSVPAGTYWAFAWFAGTGKSADTLRMDVLPQFTVAGRHTRAHLAARAATSELGAVTPRPSALQDYAFAVVRGGLHHTAERLMALGFMGDRLWVSPTTTRPSVGSLHTYTAETLSSLAHSPGVPYAYNLAVAGRAGIIPRQRLTAAPARLATYTERFYQEVRSAGAAYEMTEYPLLGVGVSVPLPVRMPGTQIQYMSANPQVAYEIFYGQFSRGYAGGQVGSLFSAHAGQRLTEDWNTDPLHPQPAVQLLSGPLTRPWLFIVAPTAYRTGNKLRLSPNPFSDNTLGHIGALGFFPGDRKVKVAGRYAVYQNGILIAHGDPVGDYPSLPTVTLSPKPAVIRFVLNATRRGSRFPLSPVSQTAWTWRSAPRPGDTLPPTWGCGLTGRRCAVQPMMTLDYQVHGLGINEAAPRGHQVIGLTVGHIEPGAPIRITGASMRISFNGGHSWQPVTVSPVDPGQFKISFTAPAGARVALRTSATDAAGGSITETIQDAYRTS